MKPRHINSPPFLALAVALTAFLCFSACDKALEEKVVEENAVNQAAAPEASLIQNFGVDFPEGEAELQRLQERFKKKYFSWHYEEWFIRDFFNDRRDGFFVDVGAYHYRDASNTYLLEKGLGWGGIAIDAQEQFREGYEQNRPRTKYFTNYVSDKSTDEKTFFVPDNPALASGVIKNTPSGEVEETIEVQEITLNDLLDREGVEKIDFLTMDIELAEPAALRGFDIGRFQPELICIEVLPKVKEFIEAYFADNGYVKLDLWSRVDSHNSYYVPASTLESAGEDATAVPAKE